LYLLCINRTKSVQTCVQSCANLAR